MERKYIIINHKTRRFQYAVQGENWDGEWKERYIHTKGADWLEVQAVSLWEHDKTPQGVYYTYDLCADGGLFCFYILEPTEVQIIKQAKSWLRNNSDVVSLRVLRLRAA